MIKNRLRISQIAVAVVILGAPALAQLLNPMRDDSLPIETRADELKYNRAKGIVEAVGNAIVTKGNRTLRADYIHVNLNTEDALAVGNVVLTEGESVWRGRRLDYKFGEGTGEVSGLAGKVDPFKINAEKTEKTKDDRYVFRDAEVTTCELDHDQWHWHATARKVAVTPDEYLTATGVKWYFGPVPVLYVPLWYHDLDNEFGFRFRPGYSSRKGAFLLSSYRYRINPYLRGESHLDYRTKRGVAVGQDFKWDDPDGLWKGDLSGYYADDQEPIADDEDPATTDVDSQRYRLRLRHTQSFTPRDYVIAQGDYLSDTDILRDFFEDEYRDRAEPDNFASYTHRADRYVANVILRSRLNDFYDSVNRLPEVSLDTLRTRIGQSAFYYQSDSAVAHLERVFKEADASGEDYSSFRFDTSHTLYHQTKEFGFLNVIPRAGYRGTYYSATREERTFTQTSLVTTTNIVVDVDGNTNALVVTAPVTTEPVTREVETGGELRSRIELGCETSFKAFRVWDDPIAPRRHILEPYANYTFVPEPSLLPDRLYQFDEVDRLGEEHFVKLGTRNKWQAKRKNNPFDIIDADVYTILRLKTAEDQDAIENVFFDVELRPNDWLKMDFDGVYSLVDSELDTFNTWIEMKPNEDIKVRTEYRLRRDVSSLLIGDVTFFPQAAWSYNLYARQEFEDSRFEEVGGYIQRKLDCLAVRTGANVLPGYTRTDGSKRDDEYRVSIEFWLTAFPEDGVRTRQRY